MIEIHRLRDTSQSVVDMLNRVLDQLSPNDPEMTVEDLRGSLQAGAQIYVAVDDGYIVGTASLLPTWKMRQVKWWVEDVVVDSHYRGQGLGRRLMELLISDTPASANRLNLTSSDENARGLYRKLGFEQRQDSDLFRIQLR